MRSMLLTLAILSGLLTLPAIAQRSTPGWHLAGHAGGSNNDYGDRITIDRDDNSYVTGAFTGTLSFGALTLQGPGRWNLYLAKYNPGGTLLWAKVVAYTTDPASDIYANGIAVDLRGNVYLGGRFLLDITFPGREKISSQGSSDMYLARFSPDGNLLWEKTPGGIGLGSYGQDEIAALAVDRAGNCMITGVYNTDARFDTISLSSSRTVEAFVARYDSSGNALWARSAGGPGALHLGEGIALDSNGNGYVTGRFFGIMTFDTLAVDAVDAEQKAFVAKVTPDGDFLWATKVGSGGYYGTMNGIAVDGGGNSYVAGNFRATIELGDAQYSNDGGHGYTALVVKYDRDGHYLWSIPTRTDSGSNGASLSLNKHDDLFVTGTFNGRMQIGPTQLTASTISTFVARLSPEGSLLNAQQLSGAGSVTGSGIVITSTGDCEVVGTFSDSVSIGSELLRSAGGLDMFLARLGTESAVDLPAEHQIASLLLYPNPTTGIVRVGNGRGTIRVFSLQGIQLLESEGDRIDMSRLAAGIYFVKVGDGMERLVKE